MTCQGCVYPPSATRRWGARLALVHERLGLHRDARNTLDARRRGRSGDREEAGCGYCNTLVLSMHLALAIHEHKHHPSIHEHEDMKFHFIHLLFITCDVNNIHVYACDHV